MKKLYKYTLSLILLLCAGCSCMTKKNDIGFKPAITNLTDIVQLFPKTPAEIQQRIAAIKEHTDVVIKELLAIPSNQRTFANTAQVFDDFDYYLGQQLVPLSTLKEVSPDEALVEACQQALLEVQPYLQEHVSKNVAVYQAFQAYVNGNAKQEQLRPDQQYYLDELMKGFKLSGLELPPAQLQQVKELNNKLAEIELKFSSNIAQDATQVKLTAQELAGVSQRVLDSLERDADGNYLAGVDYPTYFAILESCTVSATRQKMARAFSNRAYPANQSVLEEMIKYRHELANLLGFKTYAELELYDQMVGSPQRAYDFLHSIALKARKKYQEEVQLLTKELPAGIQLNADKTINPWDWAYVKAQYKKKHLAIDQEAIAQYFPVEHVVPAIFAIYQEFLGLRFEPVKLQGLWHPEVTVTAVYDKASNALRGYLLFDLYPRPRKYSHACMIPIVPAVQAADNSYVPAMIAVIANFPKATADTPALLKFNDVNTFFHEFGHAMHGMVGATRLASQSGTSVKRDFVEMPSQMFEEWLKDKEVLQRVSKHYKTGETLPDDLIHRLIDIDKFDSGDFYLRQISLSLCSLEYFNSTRSVDLLAIQQKNNKFTRPFMAIDPEDHQYANFGHLSGYGARYYGYLWSKVFAVDLADAVKKQGFLNPAEGKKLVDTILSKGGSKDPNLLLKEFLGREPQQEAFLEALDFEK